MPLELTSDEVNPNPSMIKPRTSTAQDLPKSRILRVDITQKGLTGWTVRFGLNTFTITRFFSDTVYGGSNFSREAAEQYAVSKTEHISEFLALKRRLWRRQSWSDSCPGVTRLDESPRRGACWLAYWNDDNGRTVQRKFSVGVHGETGAMQMAFETRRKAVAGHVYRFQVLSRKLGLELADLYAGEATNSQPHSDIETG